MLTPGWLYHRGPLHGLALQCCNGQEANGKWRMCVDFTNLNKVCPKDCFSLPSIYRMMDASVNHQVLTFMDAFSGYNQIFMHSGDQERTSFTTEHDTYCYNVMPFDLKNAGSTYQRLVKRIFNNEIGESIKVYVDHILVKSPYVKTHIEDLTRAFQIFRRNKMMLNPTKCTFGEEAGKFIGFMISRRRIEANPQKIQAIQDMAAPLSQKTSKS